MLRFPAFSCEIDAVRHNLIVFDKKMSNAAPTYMQATLRGERIVGAQIHEQKNRLCQNRPIAQARSGG